QDIFNKHGVSTNETTFTSGALLNFNNIDKSIEEARSKVTQIQSDIKSKEDEILQHQNAFVQGFQAYNETLYNDLNITDDKVKNFLNNLSETFVKSKDINKKNFVEMTANYREFIDQVVQLYQNGKLNLANTDTVKGLQNLKVQLQGLKSNFSNIDVLISAIDNSIKNFNNDVQQGTQGSFDYGNILSSLSDTFKEAEDALKPLNQALYDLSQKQSLTSDQIADLILQYPELASQIHKTTNGWTLEKDAIEDLRKKQIQTSVDALKSQLSMSNSAYAGLSARLTMYGIEIDKIQDLQDALNAVNKINQSNVPTNVPPYLRNMGNTLTDKLESDVSKLGEAREQIKKLEELLNDPTLGVSTSKTKKTDNKDFLDATQARINEINKEAKARAELNKQISDRAKELESEKKYEDAIKKTTELLASQKKEIALLNEANKRLNEERNKLQKTSKYDMSSWVDENGEATQSYIKLYNSLNEKGQKALSQQFEKVKLLTQALKENNQTIEDLNASLPETQRYLDSLKLENTQQDLDNRKKVLEDIDYNLSVAEKTQAMYLKGTKEYNDQQVMQNSLLQKKINYYKNEIGWTEKYLKQGNLTKDQIELLNQYLRDNMLAFLEAQKAAQDYADTLSDDIISNYKKMLEQQRDLELKAIDAQIDAENERHDQKMKNLDD
ncbi:MAG: hypothetical protein QJR05_13595, partial [Thermoanaerobacterium sp.]|nr:hypothetical protein [Thermoanaerobacterium sp.]